MVKINPVVQWAYTETEVSEPDPSLQSVGYEGGDQPAAQHHNWIWWSRDRVINQLIHDRNHSQSLSNNATIPVLVSEQYTNRDWLHPYSAPNLFDLGSNAINMCRGWNYQYNRPTVFAVRNGYAGITELFNTETGVIGGIDRDLTLDNAAETIDAICSDADYLYVMTTGKPGYQATFYKFSCNPWSATKIWSYDTTLLFSQTNQGKNALIVANSDWIATPVTGQSPDSGVSVLLINKDGLSIRQGIGNAPPASATYRPAPTIVSNEINLFFVLENTVGAGQSPALCTADIADPTQYTYPGGTFGQAWVFTGNVDVGAGSLIYDGRLVHALLANGKIYSFDWETYTETITSHPQWQIIDTPSPQAGTDNPSMTFDGLHAWALLEYDGESNAYGGMIVPVNIAEQRLDESATLMLTGPKLMTDGILPATAQLGRTKLIFADNSLWFFKSIYSQIVYRVPSLNLRSR